MTEEQLLTLIRAEIQQVREARSPWVDMRGLAEYSGWGYNTVKRLSSRNQIPGKVRHDGKVRFHVPTFDEWLLTEHQQGPLVALPHEDRQAFDRDHGGTATGRPEPSRSRVSSDAG